jgi:alpha-1,2-mannosyltransferase
MAVRGSRDSTRAWLGAAGAVAALAALIVFVWRFWLFRPDAPYTFLDLDYYRAAAAGSAAGAPLITLLPYPPFAALVIAPVGGLSVLTGNMVWTALSLLVVVGLGVLVVDRAMTARGLDPRSDRAGLVLRSCFAGIALLVTMPFILQLGLGQLSLFIAALAVVDLAKVLPRRWQGSLVGLAGAIKLLPLVFIPYYLLTGQRRQAAVAAGSFGLFTAIGFACFPADSVAFWSSLGATEGFGDPGRFDNQSIKGLIYRWLPALGPVSAVWLGVAAVVGVSALWRARQHFQRGEVFTSALVVGGAATVLSPISWPHYHVWMPLIAVWLVLGSERRGVQLIGLAIFAAHFPPFLGILESVSGGSKLTQDLMVLVPILIGLLGLPHLADRPGAAPPSPDPAPLVPGKG